MTALAVTGGDGRGTSAELELEESAVRERLKRAVSNAAQRSEMSEEHVRDYVIPKVELTAKASALLPADVIHAGQW
jgi:2-methylaconitate cis-trans-isomerase PrpF